MTEQVAIPLPGAEPKSVYDAAFVKDIKQESVFDRSGKQVDFSELISCPTAEDKAVVIFIRHFGCGMCQAYITSFLQMVDLDKLAASHVRVSIIGSGSYAMIKPYSELLNCPIPIYGHPNKSLHQKFGMNRSLKTSAQLPEYLQGSTVLQNAISSVGNWFKMGNLLSSRGDLQQNGGDQIWAFGDICTFSHNMETTTGHTPIKDLITAAGAANALKQT